MTGRFDRDEHLLGAMDRDLGSLQAEFRAQRSMLQALHLTQNEHTKTLNKHTKTLNEHTRALRKLETGQEDLRRDLTEARVGIRSIIDLLTPADGGEPGGGSPS